MKKTVLASLIAGSLAACGGGGGEDPIKVVVETPTTGPATTSSDLTSGKHIPTLSNPNPTPTSTGSPSTGKTTVIIPPQTVVRPTEVEVAPVSGNLPPMVDTSTEPGNQVVPTGLEQSSQFVRSTIDNVDEVPGNLIHILYAVPKDGVDRRTDVSQPLYGILDGMNAWVSRETEGRKLRFDTYRGKVDVTYVGMPKSDHDYNVSGVHKRDAIEDELRALGFTDSDKVYLVYYEGFHQTSCGDSANPTLGHGVNMAVLYLANNCHTDPSYTLLASIHELLHVMGAMSQNAPMHTTLGHVDDPEDIMYGGTLDPSKPHYLDPYRINYYNPTGLPNGIWNLAYSPYIGPVSQ